MAPHDVGADAFHYLVGNLGIGAIFAALFSVLPAPAGAREHPIVKAYPAFTDRVSRL